MPSHPWQRARMEEETKVRNTYGVKTKREIWKMNSMRKNFAERAKFLIASRTAQSEIERNQIVQKLLRLGLIDQNSKFEDILGLGIESIMERRLQTLVWKKGLAKSPQQARQFIVHGHVVVAGKKISSPSYLVNKAEEAQIIFMPTSTLVDPEHPERVQSKAQIAAMNAPPESAPAKKSGQDQGRRDSRHGGARGRGGNNRYRKTGHNTSRQSQPRHGSGAHEASKGKEGEDKK